METPLGGKTSLGTSSVVLAEVASLKKYKDDLQAIGPVNSNERSKLNRQAIIENAERLDAIHGTKSAVEYKKIFKHLNLI